MQKKNKRSKMLTILSIILLVIGILLLSKDYSKNIQNNNSCVLENKTYYEVTIKPNTYFSSSKIPANNYYVANSIKSIDIYFNYNLKNKNKQNINYSYDITATLKTYADNGTKLIWTKDFDLDSYQNLNKKELLINKVYNLDYNYYVNYAKSFQEYYDIKTESYLYVKLNININNKDHSSILLTIPISEKVIDISMEEDNNFINTDYENNSFKKASFIIIFIAIIILVIKMQFNRNNEDNLLKNYQDIIIHTENKPFINSNKIIYLTNLKDLIYIAMNYNINIFNYQNNYYIIKDNTYYIYILNKNN